MVPVSGAACSRSAAPPPAPSAPFHLGTFAGAGVGGLVPVSRCHRQLGFRADRAHRRRRGQVQPPRLAASRRLSCANSSRRGRPSGGGEINPARLPDWPRASALKRAAAVSSELEKLRIWPETCGYRLRAGRDLQGHAELQRQHDADRRRDDLAHALEQPALAACRRAITWFPSLNASTSSTVCGDTIDHIGGNIGAPATPVEACSSNVPERTGTSSLPFPHTGTGRLHG